MDNLRLSLCYLRVNTFIVVPIQHDEAVNTTTALRVGQGSTSSSEAAPSSSSSPVNAEKGTAYSRMTGCKKRDREQPSGRPLVQQICTPSGSARKFAMPLNCASTDKDYKSRVDTYFIWIFHQNVLPFGHLQAQVSHGPHYTPAVHKGNVKLGGKIHWAHGSRAQNYMPGVVPRVRARNVAMGQK